MKNIRYIMVSICFSGMISFLCFAKGASVPDQKISDFYLANFNDQGTREWELKGAKARISEEDVAIDDFSGTYYPSNDTLFMSAETGRLQRDTLNIDLQKKVRVHNKTNITVETESLHWTYGDSALKTDDVVTIKHEHSWIRGRGLNMDTKNQTATFTHDITAEFLDITTKELSTVVSPGPLNVDYAAGKAVFSNAVKAYNPQNILFADHATIYFDTATKKLIKIIVEGNVRIKRPDSITFSEKGIYWAQTKNISLVGNPRIIYEADQELFSVGQPHE